MSGYIDDDFSPPQVFWGAMWMSNHCPSCGWRLNGHTMKADLLEAPVECECTRCFYKWSVAIPLGGCEERSKIERLIKLEKDFYLKRDELRGIIKQLHGES